MNVKFTRLMALLTLSLFSVTAFAKVWRVNNNAGISADFSSLTTAISNSSVLAGDTLYIEPSATTYPTVTLSKRLVLIGGGYFLSGANGNTGLQINNLGTNVTQINCGVASSGSVIIGIDCYISLGIDTDDLTLKRSNVIVFAYNESTPPNPVVKNLVVNQCYLDLRAGTIALENPVVTNCIITGTFNISMTTNGFIRNNTFRSVTPTIYNSYVANNIFSISSSTNNMVNCSIRYNIATTNLLPTDPALHNLNSIPNATLFVGTGSTDGQLRLATGGTNPAIGGGEPVNGVTPDVGAYGTADPYRLSGIASIPTIYALTVPVNVPASATSMDITISTRSNN